MTGSVGERTNQVTAVLSAVLPDLVIQVCCLSRDRPTGMIESSLSDEDGNHTPRNKLVITKRREVFLQTLMSSSSKFVVVYFFL